MPTVLITPEALRDRAGPHTQLLEDAGFEVRFPREPTMARGHLSERETLAELAGCVASIASGEVYSAGVLEQLPQFRVIARSGVGYDRVDVAAATRCRVAVTITPTANHESVAELTLALLFAVAKFLVINDRKVRQGDWPRELLRPIRGTNLGIVGLGRIGRSLAVRARALGMRLLACDVAADPEFARREQIELVDLDTLLAQADYVSLHCPLTPETAGMINRQTLARMKPGSVLLNTARGGLVVESDLYDALTSGHLAGAGLDVLEQEPPAADNRLLGLEQVVFSPHLAGCDRRSMAAMAEEAARAIVLLSRNEWPNELAVNQELADSWDWDRPAR